MESDLRTSGPKKHAHMNRDLQKDYQAINYGINKVSQSDFHSVTYSIQGFSASFLHLKENTALNQRCYASSKAYLSDCKFKINLL